LGFAAVPWFIRTDDGGKGLTAGSFFSSQQPGAHRTEIEEPDFTDEGKPAPKTLVSAASTGC
jgi:hypothetical protein